jgi:hypothetical protein
MLVIIQFEKIFTIQPTSKLLNMRIKTHRTIILTVLYRFKSLVTLAGEYKL